MQTREHPHREAWNKGKQVGQKAPLKPKDIWAIRIHLQNAHAVRDLAMFNLAIDSKLRGCDLVSLRVRDVTHGPGALTRDGGAAEDAAACAVRTDRAHTHGGSSLDREGRPEVGRLPLSEQTARLSACLHTAVCEDR